MSKTAVNENVQNGVRNGMSVSDKIEDIRLSDMGQRNQHKRFGVNDKKFSAGNIWLGKRSVSCE